MDAQTPRKTSRARIERLAIVALTLSIACGLWQGYAVLLHAR
jgi:hypothetical protein